MTAGNSPKSVLRTARRRAERILDPDARGARLELHRLSISQDGALVTVRLRLSTVLAPLALHARNGEELIQLAEVRPAAPGPAPADDAGNGAVDYIAQFRLDTFPASAADLSGGDEGTVLPVVLEFFTPDGRMPRYAVESWQEDGRQRGIISLGRFRRTIVGGLRPVRTEPAAGTEGGGHVQVLYMSRNGFLRLAVDRELRPYTAVYVKRITVDRKSVV